MMYLFFVVFLETLSDYKHLRGGVYFTDELPLTPSGKVQRNIAKKWAIEKYKVNHRLRDNSFKF